MPYPLGHTAAHMHEEEIASRIFYWFENSYNQQFSVMLKYKLHCHGVTFVFVYLFPSTSHYLWDDSFLGLVCAWQNCVQEVTDTEAFVKGRSGRTRELVPSVMLAGTAQVHAPVKSGWLSHRCANPTEFLPFIYEFKIFRRKYLKI